jgi:hypothetical protein
MRTRVRSASALRGRRELARIIVDLEATPRYRTQDVESTGKMKSIASRGALRSQSRWPGRRYHLGTALMLGWMVEDEETALHVPVSRAAANADCQPHAWPQPETERRDHTTSDPAVPFGSTRAMAGVRPQPACTDARSCALTVKWLARRQEPASLSLRVPLLLGQRGSPSGFHACVTATTLESLPRRSYVATLQFAKGHPCSMSHETQPTSTTPFVKH